MIYLYSYPRCGSTWIRYIAEHFSGRPTRGMNYHVDKPISARLTGTAHKGEPILIKSHTLDMSLDNGENKLLVPVRHPVEAIIRHRLGSHEYTDFLDDTRDAEDAQIDYITVLRKYDEWQGPKLLIYYEDLMFIPPIAISVLIQFLGIACGQKLVDFIDDGPAHERKSIEAYKSHDNGSMTKGKDLKFHSKGLGLVEAERWLRSINFRHPELYDKYLAKYEDKDISIVREIHL